MTRVSIRSFAIATMPIASLALLLSCGGEPTTTVVPPPPPPGQTEIPITGAAVQGMAPFESSVRDLMKKYHIPGGAIAVVRNGKLFYARGFGYADVEKALPVAPDALFRIASVSKPITGVAIMKLVEEGKLALDDRVAPLIAYLTPAAGATVDPRWEQITIRQLLDQPAAGIGTSRADSIRCFSRRSPRPRSGRPRRRLLRPSSAG